MAIGNSWVTSIGAERSVNIETTSGGGQYVDIAALAGGGAVAVWQEYDEVNSNWESYAQMLDADGNKVGSKIYVSDLFGFSNANPQVAGLADGGFAVTFEALDGHGTGWGTVVRQYDATGNAVSWERVNDVVDFHEVNGDVAGLGGGNYVVVWDSDTPDGIFAQLMNSSGAPIGADFRVSTTSFGIHGGTPHVRALSDGGFFVFWQTGFNEYGQRFDASGVKVGAEVELIAGSNPDFAVLAGGQLALTWTEYAFAPGNDVFLRLYHQDGTAATGKIPAHAANIGSQLSPGIFALGDGGFLVTWDHQEPDGSGYALMARRFGANGEPVGDEFLVNDGDGSQFVNGEPKLQVAELTDGNLMFSWIEQTTDPVTFVTTNEIKTRVFDPARIHQGTSADDLLTANARENWMAGLDGNDTMKGFGGNDILYGDAGADHLLGSAGNDTLDGGDDRDTLQGGGGSDDLNGGKGKDFLKGEAGADTVDGSYGNDKLSLGGDNDRGYGGRGNDKMRGDNGNDTLYGDAGNDKLFGGNDDDKLNGGDGNDTLSGGGGNDAFVFTGGQDVITDWDKEKIRFDQAAWGGGGKTAAEVIGYATDVGSDTVFDFGNGNTLTVQGTIDWPLLETWISVF